MEVKKVCLGLLVLVLIIVLCILKRKSILKSYETFTCALEDGPKTHLEAYYNRCIDVYKIDERLKETDSQIRVPVVNRNDDNSARELVSFYLNQNEDIVNHDEFTKFGYEPGWTNQINKRSIMPEWAYYLFKMEKLFLYEGKQIDDGSIDSLHKKFNDFMNQPKIKLDKLYYEESSPSKEYLNDFNEIKFNINEKEFHKRLLLFFLSKIQRTEVSIHPTSLDGISLIWGVPYLTIKDGKELKSINTYGNIPNFNNYYQIKFRPNSFNNNREQMILGYNVKDEMILLNQRDANPTNSYFEIISATDCNQYLKIKTKAGKFLRINDGNNNLETGGESDEYNKIILTHNLESGYGDLGLNIDKIFIPNTNPSTREGEPVNMLFKAGKSCSHWLAFLGISNDINNPIKVFKNSYDTLNNNDLLPKIFDGESLDYITNYEGIVFYRTNELINKDKYSYQEIRQKRPIGDKGDGLVEDIGLVKAIDKNNINAGFINAGENITTGQKIFPVVSDNEILFNNSTDLMNQCDYTGTHTSEEDIEAVCKSNPKCYGIYKDPTTNHKMAYTGSACNRDLKYFDRYKLNKNDRISRGKINCQLIGEKKEIGNDGSFYNICYLPKYNNSQEDNSLVSLLPAKRFDDDKYCQINLDYGTLDSGDQYTMYVNNAHCNGPYEYAGAPLKGEGQCSKDDKCVFNKFSMDDEVFLINQDFGRLFNENVELKKKLNKLSTKVNNFKQNLSKQNSDIESNNKILSDNLNEFKIIKMNDIMNNFNYHTVNELTDSHK